MIGAEINDSAVELVDNGQLVMMILCGEHFVALNDEVLLGVFEEIYTAAGTTQRISIDQRRFLQEYAHAIIHEVRSFMRTIP
jgi:hypothetical protein